MYSKEVSFACYDVISIYEWRDYLLKPHKEDLVCYNNLSSKALEEFEGDLLSAEASLANAVKIMDTLFIINKFVHDYSKYKFILETPLNLVKYTIYIVGWLYIIY